MQSRLKSWPLWVAIVTLVVYASKTYLGYEIPGVDGLLDLILPVVVGFGIVNNPTDPNNL